MVKLFKPEWTHVRVIHSRFPPTNIFDSVDAADQLLLAELEGATNDRLTNWNEWLPANEFRSGPGWGAVMASFCHFSPGRFNDASFGAYYCSDDVHTAIKEWSFHAGIVWRDHRFTDVADATVRSYVGEFTEPLVDLRDHAEYHTDAYDRSQTYANVLKKEGQKGVLYNSVRHDGGLCAGLFAPSASSPVRQSAHYVIQWNGSEFTHFAKLGDFKSLI